MQPVKPTFAPRWCVILTALTAASPQSHATDCNLNGKDDAEDITALEPGFGEPVLIAEVRDPSALVGLDADGDGDTDLIAASAETRTITVILNQGGGRFSQGATLPAGIAPRRLVAGDFDGDRRADLVVVGADTQDVTILRNAGGGAFEAPRTLHVDATTTAGVAVNDLDRDGDLDLALAVEDASHRGSISLFLNDGKGGFVQGPVVSTQRYSPSAVAAQDLNGDGHVDLVTANSPDLLGMGADLSVFLGTGGLGFNAAPEFPWLQRGPSVIFAVRLDDDAIVDILVVHAHSAYYLAGHGDGTFESRSPAGAYGHADPAFPALLDLNGDGRMDLAVAHYAPEECEPPAGQVMVYVNSEGALWPSETIRLGIEPHGLVADDFDGDGDVDLAVAGSSAEGIFLVERKPVPHSKDCNANGIPDECDVRLHDCNSNGTPDDCDIASATSGDCNRNGVPDECEHDCNASGLPDDCDIAAGSSADCNRNNIPDDCELAVNDRDGNGTPDDCDIANGSRPDCNGNGAPDPADLVFAQRFSTTDRLPLSGDVRAALPLDLDGDGDIDIVAVREGIACPRAPGSVSVIVNLGHGAFVEGTRLPAGPDPSAIAAGDFDGDGDIDLAVGHRQGDAERLFSGVGIFWNRGNGLLETGPWFGDGTSIKSLVAVDLDQDGDADLVALTSYRGVMSFLNLGNGTLGAERELFKNQEGSSVIASGDLDGDGDVDFAVATFDITTGRGEIQVRFNDGGGIFEHSLDLDTGTLPTSLMASDVDGDARIDLVAGSDSAAPLISWNRGRGVFDTPKGLGLALNGRPVLVEDVDGDGRKDLVVLSPLEAGNEVLIYFQRGHAESWEPAPFGVTGYSRLYGASDFDGNGTMDLLLGSSIAWNGIAGNSGAWNGGAGRFIAPRLVLTRDPPMNMDAADIDGDGNSDVVTASAFAIDLLWNNGKASLTLGQRVPIGSNPSLVLARDLNGDGRIDIVSANSLLSGEGDDNISVLINEGNRAFGQAMNFAVPRRPTALEAADLDGDADLDLVMLNPSSFAFAVLKNRGDGTFGPASRFITGFSGYGLALGDFDGDGDIDAAILNPSWIGSTLAHSIPGAITLFANTGKGEFASGVKLENVDWPGGIAAVDMDGDGRTDIVTANKLSGSVSVSLQQSRGTFADPVQYPAGVVADFVTAADVDLDGEMDIVASGNGDSDLSVLFGRGSGSLSEPIPLSSGLGVARWTVADFTGDGLPDLGATVSSLNAVAIIDNLSGPTSRDLDHDGIPDECESGGAKFIRGDSNGDGNLDISDAVATLRFLFAGGASISCDDAADANDDGRLDITDAIATLLHLFAGAGPLPEPAGACGVDPTADGLRCGDVGRCRA